MLDFDEVLVEIGEFGRYQQFVMWLLCIPACFLNAYNDYGLVFLMYTPEHKCSLPSNASDFVSNASEIRIVAEQCHILYYDNATEQLVRKEACSEWTYDTTYFQSTLVTEWDLVCDKAIQPSIVVSVFNVAAVVGCLFYAFIQDRWGRKICVMVSLTTCLVGSLSSLYMPSVVGFAAFRCLAGIGSLASWGTGYIWAMEYVGPSKRTLLTTVMCMIFALAMLSMSLLAFIFRDWIHMGLAMSVPFILVFSYWWFIDESPRWLLSQGRIEEAQKVIDRMLRWDKKPKQPDLLKRLIEGREENAKLQETPSENDLNEEESKSTITTTTTSAGVLDLFRRPNICKKTLLIMLAYVANDVVYTSIAYNTENLGDNFYLTWALTASMDIPAGLVFMFVANRYGRTFPHGMGMILAGVFCILTAPGEYLSSWLVITLAMIGKLIITITYDILSLLSGELFPTVVRGSGVGVGAVVGNAATIAMPYMIYSAGTYKMLPMIIMGVLSIIGGIGCLFLPETLNQYMPETLEEAETHGIVCLDTAKGHFKRVLKKTT